jgi:hypothetical protein
LTCWSGGCLNIFGNIYFLNICFFLDQEPNQLAYFDVLWILTNDNLSKIALFLTFKSNCRLVCLDFT